MKRIAVDIGGTFTDCFVSWGARALQAKALTTHGNLALGFNRALDQICAQLALDRGAVLSAVDSVRYATTLGTNALIERKGPKVGVLITHGFEGTLAVSRGRGYGEGLPVAAQMDLTRAKRPAPLVPVTLVRGVRERIDYLGQVVLPIDEDDLRLKIRELVELGVEALVISCVNGTVNPAHERRIRRIFREEYPSSTLGAIPVVEAAAISGRRGEYVRTTSAVIDAYLHATMFHAMSALELNLRDSGYAKPMLLVHNTGGMAHLNSTDALQTVHSGPVAGIAAAESLGLQTGIGNVVSTDMGGTSFDIGIVVEGGFKHYDFNPVIDRWLVTVPMVHLASLGAGGGSIARYDAMYRTLRIGPDSAGSDPGPACYGRGGAKPTVTDADLLLGYLDPEGYAGGSLKLQPRRAANAFRELAAALALETIEVAKRVKRRVDADMAVGISSELGSRGYRAQDFTILAYGGNGPLHCCGIADAAGIARVLVPPFSSVFSACGAGGMAQLHIHEFTRTTALYNQLRQHVFDDYAAFNDVVAMLEERGRRDLLRQGVPAEHIRHRLELDIRYGAQKIDTAVVLDRNRLESSADVLDVIEKHRADYERRYGAAAPAPETGIWISTYRVASYVEPTPVAFGDLQPQAEPLPPPAPRASRECHYVGHDAPLATPVYGPEALTPGTAIAGPAIVDTGATTYLVEPGWRLDAVAQGGAWLTRIAWRNGHVIRNR
ncbi:MAG: hydantoinase/oxoprolinase family protein [Gammaproteobacteria bacterium]|nr:hydantoinase/oxoprolinase family protein [Gammaproteobacteria bacterium]